MKRSEPESIGDIIRHAIDNAGLTTTMAEHRACFLWPQIVGQGINRFTTRRFVQSGVMHVYLTSAPLRQELSFHASRLVEEINRAVGSNVITSIKFH